MMKKTLLVFVVGMCITLIVLDVQAQPSSDSKSAVSTSGKKASIKPWSEIIPSDVKADSGLFNVYRVEDKLLYEIPKKQLNKEFLLVTRIAKTPQIGYGGEQSNIEVIRWERKFDKVFVRAVSYVNIANDTLPIARAVHAANFEEVLAAFPIQCYNKDSSSVVVDVTPLFTTDIAILTPQKSMRDQYKMSMLSTDRSYIDYCHSYPINIEVENVLTYAADAAPQNPSSRTISLAMHHSMVELPAKPMTPRLADWRVGFFSTTKTDYGLDVQRAEKRTYITRWRLEPKDSSAYFRGELVEPIKPITYYIDPATPEKWRPFLKKGIETWNSAFEKAGFKNAVRVLYPPDSTQDPEFCPEDARYSVIRYFPSPTENAYGPQVHDPRSGEIIESDIGWYHNVMNLQKGWYFTQAVADPRSHKIPWSDSLMGELIATVAAHEFGHTIGFPHNMKASSSYPVDSLRSPTFTAKYGTAPSIMDYARYNYVAQPGDGAALMPKVGPYDNFAVNWGYRLIPNVRITDDETSTLNTWIREQDGNPMLRFGDQQWITVDPSAQMEDLGDDAIKASTYGIKNLERVLGYIVDATTTEGKTYDLLEEMYNDVFHQWRNEVTHVAENVGGVVGTYKNAGQIGPVYTPVAKDKQKKCVDFLHEYVFATPKMFLNQEILRRIEASGSIDRLQRNQERVLGTVLANDKMLRLIEYSQSSNENYTVQELLDDVQDRLFAEALGSKTVASDVFRRNLQRTYVQLLVAKIQAPAVSATPLSSFAALFAPPNVYKTDVRAVVRQQLETLKSKLLKSTASDTMLKAHVKDLIKVISDGLDPKKS